eukprot:comp22317_c0_seq1/m.33159 comp22317_c0_seq1/g.33159  ORF comp22317_c0_seq1/g.33159 comp22317_c0_seq1/m.33159 type:complete len:259 (-) comp22317_c0_seq1:469-1245(-)
MYIQNHVCHLLSACTAGSSNMAAQGSLTLVGAGPGDPELLTIAGQKALQRADLVVADRLIVQEILDMCGGEVRVANKVAGKSDEAQDELSEWCLEGLQKGQNVVRLKIGDPFLYGRAGEEILFFRQHGYEPRVIPGISSAMAAPLVANVPLTHRAVADHVLIHTGRGHKGALPSIPPFHPLRSTVLLMAVGRLAELSELLLGQGYPGTCRVVFVENATCRGERQVHATVATMHEVGSREQVKAPAVIVIGDCVGVLHQ